MAKDQGELLNTVLNVTRTQLTKAMSLSAELEALLIAEKQKSDTLEKENRELSVELEGLKKIARKTAE